MASLPTAKEVTLRDIVVQPENAAILCKVKHAKKSIIYKTYTLFAAEKRATGGKHTPVLPSLKKQQEVQDRVRRWSARRK